MPGTELHRQLSNKTKKQQKIGEDNNFQYNVIFCVIRNVNLKKIGTNVFSFNYL
jgi:hypothetical protein